MNHNSNDPEVHGSMRVVVLVIIILALATIAALVGGAVTANDASASEHEQGCVTRVEFDALPVGLNRAEVDRFWGASGQPVGDQTYRYFLCGYGPDAWIDFNFEDRWTRGYSESAEDYSEWRLGCRKGHLAPNQYGARLCREGEWAITRHMTISPAGVAWTDFKPCRQEDSTRCYWNARLRGNGYGQSFIHHGNLGRFYSLTKINGVRA